MASHHSISNSSSHDHHGQHKPEHTHRRLFIGPLPERVISGFESQHNLPQPTQKKRWFRTAARQDTEESATNTAIVRQLSQSFFLRQGGKQEDWNEQEEEGVREEMLRRWRDSEWGSAIHRRRKKTPAQESARWVGGSFEVGGLFGMNILQEATDAASRISTSSSTHPAIASPASHPNTSRPSNAETFVTAPSEPSTSIALLRIDSPHSPYSDGSSPMQLPVPDGNADTRSTTSITPLMRPDALQKRPSTAPSHPATEVPRRPPILKVPSLPKSDFAAATSRNKGKQKVHYAESPMRLSPLPASPTAVLERSGSEVIGTSAGAMEDDFSEDEFTDGNVRRGISLLVPNILRYKLTLCRSYVHSSQALGQPRKYQIR